MKKILQVKGVEIVLYEQKEQDFISLTDIARFKNGEEPRFVIQNRMKSRNTLEYLGIWEGLYNEEFNRVEFDTYITNAGSNTFVMTPKKRITTTCARGIISKAGRGGGTFAHKDIAFKFASWISPEFELYIIKDYQRLKIQEEQRKTLGRDAKRMIASMNYKIQTDAIQTHLIPTLEEFQQKYAYADEADMLNLIIWGQTAKERREGNPELAKKANMRDYSDVISLVILANLESFNAQLIEEGLSRDDRYKRLLTIAQSQKRSLISHYHG